MAMKHYEGELGTFDYDDEQFMLKGSRSHPCLRYIGDGSGDITIPDGIVSCRHMFEDCKSLTKTADVPDTVTDQEWMYCGCENLKEVTDKAVSLNARNVSNMFSYCKSLTKTIDVPNTVTNQECMYDFCENLTEITDKAVSPNARHVNNIFDGCDKSERLSSVPSNVDGYAEMRNKLQQSKTNNKAKSKQRVTTTNEFLGIQSDSKELNDVQLKEL